MTEIKIIDTNNNTKATLKDVGLMNTISKQAKGLMFSKKSKTLLFNFKKEKNIALHMCFVFFPIDLVFVSSDWEVVELKRDFKQWTFYTSRAKAKYVIEMPINSIENHGIIIGDKIKVE